MSTNISEKSKEQLLQAWLNMSLMIRGNRLVNRFSLNEMVICRILCEQRASGGEAITATELCRRMQLLKSQINKLLTNMEKSGLIERVRSAEDKRKIEIRMREEAVSLYEEEHERILRIIEHVSRRLGPQQAQTLTALLNETVAAIMELPAAENRKESS